ncbi:MAG: DUF2062 domain-containing protein [Desulfobulbus sp.]|nr:MAG: DUF2062 domain-containing protein [Desulfobulbus sp.]
MKLDFRRLTRLYYLRFIRLKGSPASLAKGAAVGAAIAITPTLPLHTVMIIGATLLFRVNTIAALIVAAVISNPLTFAAQYFFAWRVGDILLPHRLSWERLQQVLAVTREAGLVDGFKTLSHLSVDAMLVMMTGGIILAIPTAIITYYASYRLFDKIQKKRQEKHLLK